LASEHELRVNGVSIHLAMIGRVRTKFSGPKLRSVLERCPKMAWNEKNGCSWQKATNSRSRLENPPYMRIYICNYPCHPIGMGRKVLVMRCVCSNYGALVRNGLFGRETDI